MDQGVPMYNRPKDIRELTRREEAPKIDTETSENALYTFTGLEQQAVWPWQLMANAMVLAPKPSGGEKTLDMMNFTVRL